MPEGPVWISLILRGMTRDKLIKEWKKKSLFYLGKAELMRQNYKKSVEHLEAALRLIVNDPTQAKHVEELKELIAQAGKKLSSQLQKEKAIWSKAFEKNSTAPHEEDSKVISKGPSKPNKDGNKNNIAKHNSSYLWYTSLSVLGVVLVGGSFLFLRYRKVR